MVMFILYYLYSNINHKQFLYRWSEPDTVAEVFRLFGTPACWRGAGSLRRLGEPASRSKLPLSNRGVLLQRTREKINTKLLICNDL